MKKLIFSSILFLFCYSLVEIFSYVAYRAKFGAYQVHDLQLAKLDAIQSRDKSTVFVPENLVRDGVVRRPILHPYFGFSLDAKVTDPECKSSQANPCKRRLKVDMDRPFAKRSDKTAIVAIMGGSFAEGTARGAGGNIFERAIQSIPALEGKEVIIYNMSMGAYKQPQQLMQLSYYLAMGAEFDVIINLDGFNEMAATYYGWRDADLHPAFPKSWNHRVSSAMTKDHLRAYGRKFELLESRANLAEKVSTFPIRWSPLANFGWRLLDAGYLRKVASTDAEIDQLRSVDKENRDFAYEALGPDYQLEDWQDVAEMAADLWANSSIALRDLAEGNGARYYHFLQPNQYIEGAKILSAEEQEIAILKTGGYGNVYRQAFPILQERFEKLTSQGVHFYDLTFMFKDTPDTLYIDNCCHLNPKGYHMVIRELVRRVSADHYPINKRGLSGDFRDSQKTVVQYKNK